MICNELEIDKIIMKNMEELSSTAIKEIKYMIQIHSPERKIASCEYIKMKNLVFNINSMCATEDRSDLILNKIPFSYYPNSYDEAVDKTLNRIACNDVEVRALLEEVVGYCLYRRNELGKSFFLVGNGSNGKSTFLKMLTKLLGRKNVSTIDLEDLGNRFKAFQLQNKLVNIGDDINNAFVEDIKIFKKLVTGDSVNVEKKGKDAYDMFDVYAKFLFSCNSLPKIGDTSGGLMRRIEIIPFNANFKKDKDNDNFDQYIIDKLTTNSAMEYLLAIGIQGLKRVLDNKAFTQTIGNIEAKNEFELDNNPILQFIEEYDSCISGKLVSDVYSSYKFWCIDCGYKSVSINNFSKTIREKLSIISNVKKINGKSFRIYG